MQKLEGWKTFIFFGVALLVALANLLGFVDYRPSEDEYEVIAVLVSVAGLVLRYFTTTEIFASKG